MAENAHEFSTRELLIEATSRRLWQEDESDLRILDICKETNLSTSVIYGHFRSRQGLIDASLLHLFSLVTGDILATLERAAAGPHPTGSFIDTLHELVKDPDREQFIVRERQMFFRVAATALSRASIRPGFLCLYNAFAAKTDELYGSLIEAGLLDDRLSSHQWALFFESQLVSRAFHDLVSPWHDLDDWNRVANRLIDIDNEVVRFAD
jgi:AcrR family transcriptional regulator